jgi:long-chain acyl-CoA synthetase
MSLNLATMLRESAVAYPQKQVALYDGGRLTYAELDALSDRFAAGLRASGLSPGERVGIQLPNIPQFLIAYFGTLKAGCIAVPLNVLLKARELAYCLGDAQARALVTWAGVADEATKGAGDAGVPAVYVVNTPGVPEPQGCRRFEELLSPEPGAPLLEQTDPGDTAVIVYTSGTTGTPKGAELTHFQLLMNADTPGRVFGIRDDDIVMVALPLFHVFGLSSQLNVCVRFGATMSLVPRFDATKALEVIQRDGVTIFEGVPTMYVAVLRHPNVAAYDVSTLRIGISGGAPLPAEVLDAFEEKFGIVILEGYGLSETASTTTFNVSADERKIYSVGKPIWGVEVQIWDDKNQPLPAGPDNIGEIVIRGVNTMRGYFQKPKETAEVFTDGWFHSGDLGYRDEDGFYFIVDRKTDLIIRAGYNVYPREVEEVLYTHPAVANAAVIGVHDDRVGEEIKAVVQPKAGAVVTEEDIIEYVKERIAAYKYPRVVEFWDELPLGPTGKVVKKELRAAERRPARP